MKTEKQMRKALKDLDEGNFEFLRDGMKQILGHSRWNPSWTGRGFEIALHWVLEEDFEGKTFKILEKAEP